MKIYTYWKYIKNILLEKGDILLYKISYSKFKAQKNVKGKNVIEYIWFINTSNKNKIFKEFDVNIIKNKFIYYYFVKNWFKK